jgi:hypothetical protein
MELDDDELADGVAEDRIGAVDGSGDNMGVGLDLGTVVAAFGRDAKENLGFGLLVAR